MNKQVAIKIIDTVVNYVNTHGNDYYIQIVADDTHVSVEIIEPDYYESINLYDTLNLLCVKCNNTPRVFGNYQMFSSDFNLEMFMVNVILDYTLQQALNEHYQDKTKPVPKITEDKPMTTLTQEVHTTFNQLMYAHHKNKAVPMFVKYLVDNVVANHLDALLVDNRFESAKELKAQMESVIKPEIILSLFDDNISELRHVIKELMEQTEYKVKFDKVEFDDDMNIGSVDFGIV